MNLVKKVSKEKVFNAKTFNPDVFLSSLIMLLKYECVNKIENFRLASNYSTIGEKLDNEINSRILAIKKNLLLCAC